MEKKSFINLPQEEIIQQVKQFGPKVCVCPINGTRRWFTLEYTSSDYETIESGYLEMAAKGYVNLFRLFFDHGIESMLVPSFGPDLIERGEEYMQLAAEGFNQLTIHPLFLNFYENYDVRVRFYGDYCKYLVDTPYAYLIDQFDALTQKTLKKGRHCLYFGLFANDASEAVAQIAIQFYQKNNRPPTRREIIEAYYGEYISQVDIFIGFDKFSAFDMPLVAVGNEDLYFTVSPTLYMTQTQLRTILYDHIYARRGLDDYTEMDNENWNRMRAYYQANHERTLGVGTNVGGIWYPTPQVQPLEETEK